MSGPGPEIFERIEQLLQRLLLQLPERRDTTSDWSNLAFRWHRSGRQLEGIAELSPIRLDDLQGLERQREQLERNTRQFLAGLPANNALLWGARGTGKSSLIKALLNHYHGEGLRLIEVEPGELIDLPLIVRQIAQRPERFIIYCDDLSFEAGDPGYKALKSALDGSLSTTPENLLIYATSNRRHLLPEYMSENLQSQVVDTEVHFTDSIEEKVSLSERFGLWLSFHPFNQEQYLAIVRHWLNQHGIPQLDEEGRAEALRWAQARGSRSGRAAAQFARDWAGRQQLQRPQGN